MEEENRKLLNILQNGLPLCERPFEHLAKQIGVSEKDIIARVQIMKDDGVLRRIGGVFDSRALGFTSTLCTASVPSNKIEAAVKVINRYTGVTHNYLRNNKYNIWFTIIAPDKDSINLIISEIQQSIAVQVHSLPTTRKFKVDAKFTI